MKFTFPMISLAGLFITLCGHSQSVTLTVKKTPLTQVFNQIRKQTGFRFIYTKDQVRNASPVTIMLKGASLAEAMDKCLFSQELTYKIDAPYIIIQSSVKSAAAIIRPVQARIYGSVSAENGEMVEGANISVKGFPITTSTDEKGEFSLQGIRKGDILLISSIGYEPAELELSDSLRIMVSLKVKIDELDQAIVVGYGISSRRYSTGAANHISARTIAMQPVANALSAIQGRAAGVFVQTENGLPGGNVRLEIRGHASLAAGTNPLYIIDGVPFPSSPFGSSPLANGANGQASPFSIINPADIESIDILKDAEATSIYGSRAANGVVLITTKKGVNGKTKLDIDAYKGFGRISHRADVISAQDYFSIRKEAFSNAGVTPTPSSAPDLLTWEQHNFTDWQNYVFGGTADLTNIQADISGGDGKTTFLLGGNFRREGTVLPGANEYTRAGGHLSLEHLSADKKLLISTRIIAGRDHNGLLYNSAMSDFITLPPNFPIYLPDGSLNWTAGVNPVALTQQRTISQMNNLVVSSNFRYKAGRYSSIKINGGYSRITLERTSIFPKDAINPVLLPESSSIFAHNSDEEFIIEPFVDYTRSFGRLNLVTLAGVTYQQILSSANVVEGFGYSNDAILSDMGSAGELRNPASSAIESKYLSAFARINGNWKEKYLFSLNFRRDGSNRFGQDRRFGNFGSLAAGWIFSAESFFKENISFLSYGKLRASYGITGNDQVEDYAYLSTYGGGGIYQGIAGLAPVRLANTDYGWEINHKMDIGIDLGFWKDRLSVIVSYYNNRSGNQLVSNSLPSQAGFSEYMANISALIENKGFEFELSSTNIRRNGFTWKTSFNLTLPSNRLLRYPGIERSVFVNHYVVGEDLSIMKRLKFLRIDPLTGTPLFEDINQDKKLSFPEDYQIVGKRSPSIYGGFENALTFAGFEVTFFLQFVAQESPGAINYPGVNMKNLFSTATNRWQSPGDITSVPKPLVVSGSPADLAVLALNNSDYSLLNSSYVRLKNIQISYSLPAKLLTKMSVQRLALFLRGQNILTFSGRQFVDPETLNGLKDTMPVIKEFAAGFHLTL